MRTSLLLRPLSAAALLGAALSANALNIALSSAGAFVASGGQDESVLFQLGGYGSLATFHEDPIYVPGGNALGGVYNGTGYYEGTGGRLNISMTFAPVVIDQSSYSYSGTWVATGGTLTYASASGSGTITSNVDTLAPGLPTTLTTLSGSVRAVPEPASFAVLGLGAVAVLRRRKRI